MFPLSIREVIKAWIIFSVASRFKYVQLLPIFRMNKTDDQMTFDMWGFIVMEESKIKFLACFNGWNLRITNLNKQKKWSARASGEIQKLFSFVSFNFKKLLCIHIRVSSMNKTSLVKQSKPVLSHLPRSNIVPYKRYYVICSPPPHRARYWCVVSKMHKLVCGTHMLLISVWGSR